MTDYKKKSVVSSVRKEAREEFLQYLISLKVFVPRLGRHDLVGSAVALHRLDVGLLLHAIQVLVQTIKKEREQLLRVLLLIARELRRKLHVAVRGRSTL